MTDKIAEFNPGQFLILVVDDINKNLQLIGEILDDKGYDTTFATSGQQALARIETIQPDLILLDLMMPKMNGLQVCEQLKANPQYQEIPIIFLTASTETEHLLQAFAGGAVDYITKPFKVPELLARVKLHLELKHTKDQLKKALQELEKLAGTDSLTGVANRRQLTIATEKELSRVRRYGHSFSMLLLDIDHFKQVNDTYGHPVGDRVIVTMTDTIQSLLRRGDSLGRLGGEEFVVLLPHTNSDKALLVAERIRQRVAQIAITVPEATIYITVSIGVATYLESDRSIDNILKRADDALYEAKNQGRDRVVLSPANQKIATMD